MSDVPRPNPELMIIGDSLAQGCRSLTVKQDFCAQSWAAQIAQQRHWDFVVPDFPRPILFDLEAEIRRLDTGSLSVNGFRFEGLIGRLKDNLQGWLANGRESAFTCFDNLGLTGALIYDMYTRSAATSAAENVYRWGASSSWDIMFSSENSNSRQPDTAYSVVLAAVVARYLQHACGAGSSDGFV